MLTSIYSRVLEFDDFGQLICTTCTKDLARAMRFRGKCRKTEEFLKKSMTQAGNSCLDGYNNLQHEAATSTSAVKDEPIDDCSYLENSRTDAKHTIGSSEISNREMENFYRKQFQDRSSDDISVK